MYILYTYLRRGVWFEEDSLDGLHGWCCLVARSGRNSRGFLYVAGVDMRRIQQGFECSFFLDQRDNVIYVSILSEEFSPYLSSSPRLHQTVQTLVPVASKHPKKKGTSKPKRKEEKAFRLLPLYHLLFFNFTNNINYFNVLFTPDHFRYILSSSLSLSR